MNARQSGFSAVTRCYVRRRSSRLRDPREDHRLFGEGRVRCILYSGVCAGSHGTEKPLMEQIEHHCPGEAVISSSASNLLVPEMASEAAHPERILGTPLQSTASDPAGVGIQGTKDLVSGSSPCDRLLQILRKKRPL